MSLWPNLQRFQCTFEKNFQNFLAEYFPYLQNISIIRWNITNSKSPSPKQRKERHSMNSSHTRSQKNLNF